MSQKRKIILGHVLQYASASYFSQFLGFFIAISIRRFLGPLYMGVWNWLKIFLDYSGYAHLGVTSIVPYKLPILKGEGKEAEAAKLRDTAFSFTMVCTTIFAAVVFAFSLMTWRNHSSLESIGLLVISLLIFIQRIHTYWIVVLRAEKNFSVLSKNIIFDAIINLVLIVLVVSKFKINGFYCVIIAMPILNLIFINLFTPFPFKFSFKFPGLKSYFKSGIVLWFMTIFQELLFSIDRIMIVWLLGYEQLGFYSLALMMRSYGSGLSVNLSIAIQPHFMEAIGKSSNDFRTSHKYIAVSSQITAYLLCLIFSLIFIAVTPFVTYVLPKFTSGITAMKIFLLATFFYALADYCYDYIIAINKQSRLIPIIMIAAAVNLCLTYGFIKRGWGISGVAVSVAVASSIYFFLIAIYAFRNFGPSFISLISKFFMKILCPLCYSIIILYFITRKGFSANLIIDVLLKIALFIVLFIPAILYLNRATNIVSLLKNLILEKIRNKNQAEEQGH